MPPSSAGVADAYPFGTCRAWGGFPISLLGRRAIASSPHMCPLPQRLSRAQVPHPPEAKSEHACRALRFASHTCCKPAFQLYSPSIHGQDSELKSAASHWLTCAAHEHVQVFRCHREEAKGCGRTKKGRGREEEGRTRRTKRAQRQK